MGFLEHSAMGRFCAVACALALASIAAHEAAGQQQHMMMMDTVIPPMERMGSGTTWIPDAIALPSVYGSFRQWSLMAHGLVFVQYDHQSGRRGADQLGSLNWAMLMASHEFAGGRFQFRTMLSLDAATIQDGGYPLLLQTGETYKGQPIRDRQHPHDFWMELGVLYERAVTPNLAVFVYAAPSGEPALGPVAFMHRPSAVDDPMAPLGHHWQDATHISFGVVTAGLFGKRWKAEASLFNGREPNEERWGFDELRLNSYSGRLTLNPNQRLSMTIGYGLNEPEALHTEESVHRVTASALYGRRLGSTGQRSVAVVWGANRHTGSGGFTHAALVESEVILDARNTLFGRAELAQKSGEDLVLVPASERTFNVGAVSLGYIREVMLGLGTTTGLELRATLNLLPSRLEAHYGSRSPAGLVVFVRLRPTLKPSMHEGMEMH